MVNSEKIGQIAQGRELYQKPLEYSTAIVLNWRALKAPVGRTFYRPNTRETMDIVFIKELQIETVIGIYDWERKIRQTISLDVEMATDIKRAANSDSIDDTLNYKAVAKRLIAFVSASEYELVEALAEKICDIIRSEFNVPWVRLTLHKPGAVSGSKSVGVMIERGEKS